MATVTATAVFTGSGAAPPVSATAQATAVFQANPVPTVSRSTSATATFTGTAGAAVAGPAQTVEPWTTVSLSGAGSSGGSYLWTTPTPGVVLASPTARDSTATIPATFDVQVVTFTLTAGTSTAQTAVTVLPATDGVQLGGVLRPVRLLGGVSAATV